jgi:hypothetical protein
MWCPHWRAINVWKKVCIHQRKLVLDFSWQFMIFNWIVNLVKGFGPPCIVLTVMLRFLLVFLNKYHKHTACWITFHHITNWIETSPWIFYTCQLKVFVPTRQRRKEKETIRQKITNVSVFSRNSPQFLQIWPSYLLPWGNYLMVSWNTYVMLTIHQHNSSLFLSVPL